MTAEQAMLQLGEPLLRSAGQGFEVWIYDHRAEVVFYGLVVGWTAPGSAASVGKSVDIWQTRRGQYSTEPVFLPRPAPASRELSRHGNAADGTFNLPSYRRH